MTAIMYMMTLSSFVVYISSSIVSTAQWAIQGQVWTITTHSSFSVPFCLGCYCQTVTFIQHIFGCIVSLGSNLLNSSSRCKLSNLTYQTFYNLNLCSLIFHPSLFSLSSSPSKILTILSFTSFISYVSSFSSSCIFYVKWCLLFLPTWLYTLNSFHLSNSFPSIKS